MTREMPLFDFGDNIDFMNSYLESKKELKIDVQLRKRIETNEDLRLFTRKYGLIGTFIFRFVVFIEQFREIDRKNSHLDDTPINYLFETNYKDKKVNFVVTVKETSELLSCDFSLYIGQDISEIFTPRRMFKTTVLKVK
jgi:hypothetical protein